MIRVSPMTGREEYPGADWRMTSGYATQAYRNQFGSWHTGHDLAKSNCHGLPIYAVADGLVKYASPAGETGFGNLVFIRHDEHLFSRYAHLDTIHVGHNEPVTAGQVIGLLGSTGRSTGPHLHFDLMTRSNALDWPGDDRERVLAQYIDPTVWFANGNGTSLEIETVERMRVIATSGLNVRTTPNVRGVRLYALEYEAVVEVKTIRLYANDLAWRELRYGGWVAEKFLEPVSG